MKHTLWVSLFSAAMLAAGSAYAGGGNLFGGEGGGNMEEGSMYGGASFGQATTNCMIHDLAGATEDCSSNGWKIFGGYKVTDMIAVEGGYYNLGESTQDITGAYTDSSTGLILSNPHAEGNAKGFAIAGVASLPVVDNLEVFGKAGLMHWKSEGTLTANVSDGVSTIQKTQDASKSGNSLLLGIGAGYKIDENWGVRGEYEHFNRKDIHDKEHSVGVMSAGVTYSTL